MDKAGYTSRSPHAHTAARRSSVSYITCRGCTHTTAAASTYISVLSWTPARGRASSCCCALKRFIRRDARKAGRPLNLRGARLRILANVRATRATADINAPFSEHTPRNAHTRRTTKRRQDLQRVGASNSATLLTRRESGLINEPFRAISQISVIRQNFARVAAP